MSTTHTKPTIHYLWVGPPTKTNPLAIAGHDVAGPIQMAKQLQEEKKQEKPINPIIFWCLEKHKSYYEEQFRQANVQIDVCSIESLIEKESNGSFADEAKFVMSFMIGSLGITKDIVQFKDLFSLFLLVCQPGYFFDTNVYPLKNKSINLNGEPCVKTAVAKNQHTNDFYMMYSPVRGDSEMLAIFKAWKESPCFGNLDAFNTLEGKNRFLGTLDKNWRMTTENMGVRKFSYKSYQRDNICGLFLWVDQANLERDVKYLKENLMYGDINYQTTYPSSIKMLADCSLCYLTGEDTKSRLLKLGFTTEDAYVATDLDIIYYVNKKTKICIPVWNEQLRFLINFLTD